MSLFANIFTTSKINLEAAEAIEEALHDIYISDEETGIYWVGACKCLEELRLPVTAPYNGIIRLKVNQTVYVRYQSDEPDVEIQVLGLDDEEVYGVDKKVWNERVIDALVLLPNDRVYASDEEAKAGLAVRRKPSLDELLDQVDEVFPDGE